MPGAAVISSDMATRLHSTVITFRHTVFGQFCQSFSWRPLTRAGQGALASSMRSPRTLPHQWRKLFRHRCQRRTSRAGFQVMTDSGHRHLTTSSLMYLMERDTGLVQGCPGDLHEEMKSHDSRFLSKCSSGDPPASPRFQGMVGILSFMRHISDS